MPLADINIDYWIIENEKDSNLLNYLVCINPSRNFIVRSNQLIRKVLKL